jgi:hypothetical protein
VLVVTHEEDKAALKAALKEWLDEKFSQFGKWSAGAIAAAALGVLAWLMLTANGWHR